MHSKRGFLGSLLPCAVVLFALMTAGCAHRVYDPYYHDHHHWDNSEQVYYNQWVVEAHVDPHTDYKHLSKDDQKRYWDWRHSHDHDHDHDHH